MSRKAFIGDILKYRKRRSKLDCMTPPWVRSDQTSLTNAVSSPHKGFEGYLPCHLFFAAFGLTHAADFGILIAPYEGNTNMTGGDCAKVSFDYIAWY
jgi:hypothetical protein